MQKCRNDKIGENMGNLIQLERLAKKRYFNRTELFSEMEAVYPVMTRKNKYESEKIK